MPIPEFNESGDLPANVHCATLAEVLARFGQGSLQRQLVTRRLVRIYELARATTKLLRFVIFGSYVTAKAAPNDVDIILVMADDFQLEDYSEETQSVFDHLRAQQQLGASVFFVRPCNVLSETVEEFIAHWQVTRSHTKRSIIEIIQEPQA